MAEGLLRCEGCGRGGDGEAINTETNAQSQSFPSLAASACVIAMTYSYKHTETKDLSITKEEKQYFQGDRSWRAEPGSAAVTFKRTDRSW